jgi:hypothetical protein
MAHGVRYLKTKTVVKTAALDMFLEEFVPHQMIRSLIDLCEFAVTHPDFGKAGKPGGIEYDWADQATDLLHSFFVESNCCEEDGATSPRVALDFQKGTIELLKQRYREHRREPSFERATAPVPLRLAARMDATN